MTKLDIAVYWDEKYKSVRALDPVTLKNPWHIWNDGKPRPIINRQDRYSALPADGTMVLRGVSLDADGRIKNIESVDYEYNAQYPAKWWNWLNKVTLVKPIRPTVPGGITLEQASNAVEKVQENGEHDAVKKPKWYVIDEAGTQLKDLTPTLLWKFRGSKAAHVYNVIKYVIRHPEKDGIKDLRKAKQEINALIKDTYGVDENEQSN